MSRSIKLKNRKQKLINIAHWSIFIIIALAIILGIGYLGRNSGPVGPNHAAIPTRIP